MKSILSVTVALGAIVAASSFPLDQAVAQNNTANELVRQGDFWRARGRNDLADQAYIRALQLDPNNAAARRGLSGPAPVSQEPQPLVRRDTGTRVDTAPAQVSAPRSNRQSATSSAADRAGRLRVAGYAALERGELSTAASQFEQALSINSRDADALGGLGIVRLRQDRFRDARDLLERASQSGGASRWSEALASARFFAGLEDAGSKIDAGQIAQAQTALQGLIASASDAEQKSLAAVQLGDLLLEQGRFGEALTAYSQASIGQPQVAYKIALAEAGEASGAGDPLRAEGAYRRAIESGGATDPWARYAFAGFLLEQGRRSDAAAIIQPLETSSQLDGLYAAALYYSQADRPSDASRILNRIPEASRTAEMRALDAEIRFIDIERQAKAMAAAGRMSDAIEMLGRYDSTSASVGQQLRLAGTYQSMGLTDRAGVLARSAAQQPALASSQVEPLVRLLAQTGQDDLALQVIQRSTGGNSSSVAASNLYSVLTVASADRLREQGMHAEAFDVLQSGWSLAPQNTDILVSLGRLYMAGNMSEEAVQVYGMALQRSPSNSAVLSALADAHSARGETGKARDVYRRLLRQSPDDVEAYLTAARIEQAAGDRRAARRLLEQAQRLGAPQGLGEGSAFTVNNPFRSAGQSLAPVQANPFMPDTLRASSRSTQQMASRTPVQQALADLSDDEAPRLEANIQARSRSGEGGLSNLSSLSANIKGTLPAGRGRVGLAIQPTVIDAGDMNRSARARFGRNATAEALAIVAQEPTVLAANDSQYASGVVISASYEDENFQIDVGTTPLGFERTDAQGGFIWRPRIGTNGAFKVFAERRPVTDSVLSYAGAVDPVSGEVWGSVMKTGGGFGLSWERDGTGLYGDVAYRVYAGQGVEDNNALEMNLGGYRRVYLGDELSVTAGLAMNYQSFDENLSYFTLGHGGYFSPQSFVSLSFPVDVRWQSGDWMINANITPGYQTYQQDRALLYPLDPAAQGQLDALKALNDDVRSYYDSQNRSGFAFSGGLEVWQRLGTTSMGGEARMNTFGNYDEYRMELKIKQPFGSSY